MEKENELKYSIKVLSESGEWYTNALVENDFDAFAIAMFYQKKLGYKVRVLKDEKDLSHLLSKIQTVGL